MNTLVSESPFDRYTLTLFRLVAEELNFTRAGKKAGLTQSAITRQILRMEERLGTPLFERTTRHVALTPAGVFLWEKSGRILASAEAALEDLKSGFELGPQRLRVGIARSIGLAYFPGFFFPFRKAHPDVALHISQGTEGEIYEALEERRLEIGLVATPSRLPAHLMNQHSFDDPFAFIAPPEAQLTVDANSSDLVPLYEQTWKQGWLMLSSEDVTGKELRRWMGGQGLTIRPSMELDSFDVIFNLVSLGLGSSLVPNRVLALYGGRRKVQRVQMKPTFSRTLSVVVRKSPKPSELMTQLIESILF